MPAMALDRVRLSSAVRCFLLLLFHIIFLGLANDVVVVRRRCIVFLNRITGHEHSTAGIFAKVLDRI